ncbi:unnamed protein product [Laminaria digitata]
MLGAVFHGKGDGTPPSRFLDDDDDYSDDDVDSFNNGGSRPAGLDLAPMEPPVSLTVPPELVEGGGGVGANGVEGAVHADADKRGGANGARDAMDEESMTSGHGSSFSVQLASRASSSLQVQYFGPGPKVFPDMIFLILVLSQWFLAVWSVVGAVLYFRLFQGNRTCAPLLRHWTLLVVIIGFLSCLLAVCYSGIMCCMLGSPFGSRRHRHGSSERDGFHGDVASSSETGRANGPGMI